METLAWVPHFLNMMLIAIILIYIGCFIPQILNLEGDYTTSCNSKSFLVTEGVNCLISLMFIGIGYFIDKEFKIQT